nr:hypothetical protein prokka_00006 [Shigella boydii]
MILIIGLALINPIITESFRCGVGTMIQMAGKDHVMLFFCTK